MFFLGLAAAAILVLSRSWCEPTYAARHSIGCQSHQTLLVALVVSLGIPVSWFVVSRR